jgi:hypothetical protein
LNPPLWGKKSKRKNKENKKNLDPIKQTSNKQDLKKVLKGDP